MLFGDAGDGNADDDAGAQAGDSAQGQRALPLGQFRGVCGQTSFS